MDKTVNFDDLNNTILDILREIGNIGAGNAATSLAKMVNGKIDMDVPAVKILDFRQVPELIGGPEHLVVGVFFELTGDLRGSIMFVLDVESASNLVSLLMPRDNFEFDEFTISALQEIGNILSSAYISSISSLTNLSISISVPALSMDMAGAILSVPAIQFGELSDEVLFIETRFIELLERNDINGYFFLIPDMDSYEVLLGSLGVNI